MKYIIGTILSLTLTAFSFANANQFDFKDPSGVSNLKFELKGPLESFDGSADGISGTIAFDLSDVESMNGKILVDTTSIMVAKKKMRKHIMSRMWMNAKKFPTMEFELAELTGVTQTDEGAYSGKAMGTMTVKGISEPLEADVTIRFLEGKLGAKIPGKDGNLLVVNGEFTIKRDRFDINPGNKLDEVANDIQINLSLVGYAER